MASSARIDELRKKFDENPRRYFAPLANEYRKAGDLEQAIFICQEYLPQQPGHMSGHIVYGQALYELARLDEARVVFETALSLDPENLIALRHLGDIARQAGDPRSARVWYQRVLEADPRNEEIAQIMMTLLATPDSSQAAVSSSAPTPLSTPTVTMEAVSPPPTSRDTIPVRRIDEPPPVSDLSVGPELSTLPERQPSFEPPAADEPPPIPTAPTSTWGEATTPAAGEDLLDLEDFSVGGVALSSLGTPAIQAEPVPPPTAEAPPATSETIDGFEETSLAALTQSVSTSSFTDDARVDDDAEAPVAEEGDFEDDPLAIAAAPSGATEPPIELAADMHLGLPADDTQASTFSSEPGERLPDLETFETPPEADVEPLRPSQPSAVEIETFFAGMAVTPESATPSVDAEPPTIEMPALERFATPPLPTPAVEAEAAEPAAAPADIPEAYTPEPVVHEEPAAAPVEEFVTETMAELYLEQGHLESAIDIYRKLVAQRPDDDQLAGRLRDAEALLYGPPPREAAPEPEPAAAPSSMSAAGTPTIREFLFGFLKPAAPDVQAAVEPPAAESPSYDAGMETPVLSAPAVEAPAAPDPSVQDAYVEDTYVEETYEQSTFGEVAAEAAGFADLATPAASAAPMSATPAQPIAAQATPGRPSAAVHATPSSSETISGSIDALFSGADASAADLNAATTLAQAFAPDTAEQAPLQGRPAHAASSELSLDHVFKTSSSRHHETENDGFSFDQFFADELGESGSRAGAEPPAAPGKGGDDIAQFNQWLNGLKKT